MEKYWNKKVVAEGEFVEGLIVEYREGNPLEVVCRKYYKENGELQVEPGMHKIDIVQVINKRTKVEKIRELTAQVGTSSYYISENVAAML